MSRFAIAPLVRMTESDPGVASERASGNALGFMVA
jgi:hypothetical protein